MMDPIFFSQYNSELDRHLVIEGDDHSVWAYIVMPESNQIEMSAFLCSRGTLLDNPEEAQDYIRKGSAPPLAKAFATEHAVQANLTEEDIAAEWQMDSIFVLLKGEEFLEIDLTEKKAFCKAISQPGPYGDPAIS